MNVKQASVRPRLSRGCSRNQRWASVFIGWKIMDGFYRGNNEELSTKNNDCSTKTWWFSTKIDGFSTTNCCKWQTLKKVDLGGNPIGVRKWLHFYQQNQWITVSEITILHWKNHDFLLKTELFNIIITRYAVGLYYWTLNIEHCLDYPLMIRL